MTASEKDPASMSPIVVASQDKRVDTVMDSGTADGRLPHRFSIVQGWCWLLACLSLCVSLQQFPNYLKYSGHLHFPTRNDTVANGSTLTHASPPRFIVNVNQAPVHELQALPDVGQALAARIVAHRQSQGPFRQLEDLLQVRGVGQRTLHMLRPMLVLHSTEMVGAEAGVP